MKKLLLSIGLLGLSACALSPSRQITTAAYDFGPVQAFQHAAASPRLSGRIVVDSVTAPAWMDNSSMYYRLAYQNAASPQRYAESRWVMSPAALLAARLESRVAQASEGMVVRASNSPRDEHNLTMELDEFDQIFDGPDRSRVVIALRATLRSSDGSRIGACLWHRAARIDPRCRGRGASADPSLRRAHPAHHRLGRGRPVGCATGTGSFPEGDPHEDAVGRCES